MEPCFQTGRDGTGAPICVRLHSQQPSSAGPPLGPGPDIRDITKSMINYHYESYFERETQEGTREGAHEGGAGGCVGLPGGPAVPGIETTDLGGL